MLRSDVNNITLWKIDVLWKEREIFLRIVPWYAPSGLEIEIWIDIDWNTTNNIAYIWVRFEKNKLWETVWVIHTIQYGLYNIWFKDNELIGISSKNDIDTLGKKEKQKLIQNVWKLFFKEKIDPNSARFVLALVSNMLLNTWYSNIEVINPLENIWLSAHNPNRDIESIRKSGYNQYVENPSVIWWNETEDGRMKIDQIELQKYFDDNIKTEILETFAKNISDFSDISDFFKSSSKIEDINELNEETKDVIAKIMSEWRKYSRQKRELWLVSKKKIKTRIY